MAKASRVLSIDITNESITIVDITASAKKQTYIHKVLIFETPEDSYEDGTIRDPERIANEIKGQLSAAGISNKTAVFVMNSTRIINREVTIPFVKENKVAGIIQANASDYFPVSIDDYIVSHSVLETMQDENGVKQMRIMAVAAPEAMVRSYYDLGAACGLKVQDIDYIGNSMLQLIKTQTTEQSTTMVIQLGSEATVLNVVQGDKLLLQRNVPYGTNPAVNVVMEERGVDATTAMTLLQNDRIITVDFDDNDATGAFRYLINNIGRVMDYYASQHPNEPIDDVFLTGDGALIKGIDGLFKIQLNVSTRIMDTLFNVKFDPSIDQKVYSPVYLISPIGAAINPMGFELGAAGGAAGSGEKKTIGYAPFIIFTVICAIAAAALSFWVLNKKSNLQDEKRSLEAQIAEKEYIEKIIAEHAAAKAKRDDAVAMSASTYHLNEQALAFINEFEGKIPKSVYITNFASSDGGVNVNVMATGYDDVAQLIVNLKSISIIEDVYVASVATVRADGTGDDVFQFGLTCKYVAPQTEEAEKTEQ
ncbi:MAG: pilus assembly protein PilM [Eubacterium sp.]|nr:pilus assembly protein PilM [Eubacterium sp.]